FSQTKTFRQHQKMVFSSLVCPTLTIEKCDDLAEIFPKITTLEIVIGELTSGTLEHICYLLEKWATRLTTVRIYIFTPGGYSTWTQYDFQKLCASLRRCTALRTFAFVSELFIHGLVHLFYDFAFPNLRELKIVSDRLLNMRKWNNEALNHLTQLHLGPTA